MKGFKISRGVLTFVRMLFYLCLNINEPRANVIKNGKSPILISPNCTSPPIYSYECVNSNYFLIILQLRTIKTRGCPSIFNIAFFSEIFLYIITDWFGPRLFLSMRDWTSEFQYYGNSYLYIKSFSAAVCYK